MGFGTRNLVAIEMKRKKGGIREQSRLKNTQWGWHSDLFVCGVVMQRLSLLGRSRHRERFMAKWNARRDKTVAFHSKRW